MNILYDISVLGSGHRANRARTGVFRVVENIASGLARLHDYHVAFSAGESEARLYESLDYLESSEQFEHIQLQHHKMIYLRRFLGRRIELLNEKINFEQLETLERLKKKTTRKLFFHLNQFSKLLSPSLIPQKTLQKTDIFHSPFYAIPDEIHNYKAVKQFITIYDLIPILYPQFFQFNEDHLIKRVIGSITPDTYVLCISHATKQDLCNYCSFLDPAKVIVTHLAASELFYPCANPELLISTRQKYGIPINVPYILSLSTLEPRKNIDHTIRCFAQLVQQEHLQDLCLVLVGTKGWDYDSIFSELSNYRNLADRIIITGYVADEDLAPLYSGALAFVYPSFYEGFGLPPLEAMKCGVPVITSNTSSLPEVVGDAGIMVAPTDTDALCQSLLQLYNNSSLRSDLSQKALLRATEFSWDKCVQQTVDAYKMALNN